MTVSLHEPNHETVHHQPYTSMVITRTPFRISFVGGGTDYPEWYLENGGSVLATTFNKYCYLICRYLPPFFEHKYRISYSIIETAKQIDEIEHPAVRAILNFLNFQDKGLEIHYNSDLPARSGLGSSSAFTVGLLNALKALQGEHINQLGLGKLAVHIEQNVINEAVGSQDQIMTAVGGLKRIDFHTDGSIQVHPLIAPVDRIKSLESNLMLFFTGFSRFANEIAQSKIANLKTNRSDLRRMHQMVGEGINILQDEKQDLNEFGKLLHEGWQIKRGLSNKVTTNTIDDIYNTALKAGAIGGKLLGAGGGGFMLLFVTKELQAKVVAALQPLLHIDFKFECEGSRLVL